MANVTTRGAEARRTSKALADADLSPGSGDPRAGRSATSARARCSTATRPPPTTRKSLNVPFAEATFYHDITARYRLRAAAAWTGLEVFGGVNNIFGEEPPFVTIGTGNDVAYDLGRFFFIGRQVPPLAVPGSPGAIERGGPKAGPPRFSCSQAFP